MRALQKSYKKVVRETELVLQKVEGGQDLLSRLKSIQKSESKDFNKTDDTEENTF